MISIGGFTMQVEIEQDGDQSDNDFDNYIDENYNKIRDIMYLHAKNIETDLESELGLVVKVEVQE